MLHVEPVLLPRQKLRVEHREQVVQVLRGRGLVQGDAHKLYRSVHEQIFTIRDPESHVEIVGLRATVRCKVRDRDFFRLDGKGAGAGVFHQNPQCLLKRRRPRVPHLARA